MDSDNASAKLTGLPSRNYGILTNRNDRETREAYKAPRRLQKIVSYTRNDPLRWRDLLKHLSLSKTLTYFTTLWSCRRRFAVRMLKRPILLRCLVVSKRLPVHYCHLVDRRGCQLGKVMNTHRFTCRLHVT